ncbi:MAG: Rieske 2Fe-2S domain-containing protein [Jatrophihabitans sp.]
MTTTQPSPTQLLEETEVRSVDAGVLPTRFARGWHCLGRAENFTDGTPHRIEAFGAKLVVFQGQSGALSVLDAYCRHMGGDLSLGTVKGDEIACPFHDWRWGGDGRCKQIPYARRVPPRARTAAWPTLVQDGLLFVYNDPEKNPPPADVAIPRIPEAESDEWTDWIWGETVVDANCREVIDNVADMAHFFYVHFSFPTFFKNVFEGHTAAQSMKGIAREDVGRQASAGRRLLGNDSDAAYYGPSFMIDNLVYKYEHMDVSSILINCHYPVSADKFVLMSGIIVRKSEDLPDAEATDLAHKLAAFIATGFQQDVEIWKSKTRIDNPLLTEQDGPVYQLRQWYEQFYVDVADVTPEMTSRFEFELDTSKPIEAWKREVADNLARRDSQRDDPGLPVGT